MTQLLETNTRESKYILSPGLCYAGRSADRWAKKDETVRFENSKPGIKAVDDRNKAINIRGNEYIVNRVFIPMLLSSCTNSLKPCSKTNKQEQV